MFLVLWREVLKLVKDWDQKDAFGSLGTGKSKRASICNVIHSEHPIHHIKVVF